MEFIDNPFNLLLHHRDKQEYLDVVVFSFVLMLILLNLSIYKKNMTINI